jgi:membrane protease YdiL (CAAX protease family)
MSKTLTLLLFFCLGLPLSAQDADQPEEAPSALDALPGYWQFTHNDPLLGTLAAAGTVANLAPLFVTGSGGTTEYWVERGGEHYFAWTDPSASNDGRELRAGVGLAGIWGGFFSVYADWDRYVKTDHAGRRDLYGSLTMADYLLVPFQPQFVFNFDVFPVFPLLELYPMTLDDWRTLGGYFQRDHVDFLGHSVSPAAGLGFTALGAVTLVAANAALEEITYRGMLQDRMGVVGSALFFGANHLLNPFALPNFSFEAAAQQAGFATLFGLYAGSRTEANRGDFRRMIALHFWHNVTSLVLGYMLDPEHGQLFRVTFSL